MTKVLAIVGPTAVGKTALSVHLAHRLNGAVISGDSMQVYRKLDIGTAKVTPAEKTGVPHYLIDIRNVDQQYSVAEFKREAKAKIHSIAQNGQLPIIVGGTGFYLHALTNELALGNDQEESKQIREKWHQKAEKLGKEVIWQQLNQLDPEAANKIPVQNLRRTIRALEVIEKTGQLFSQQPQLTTEDDYFIIGLTTDRQKLYDRINQRVDQMMTQGLLDEARWLYDQGGEKLPAGKGIGYRELFPYFTGECSLDAAVEKIKLDSRHYAKRQLTWFRNQEDCHWFDLVQEKDRAEKIEAQVKAWLKK